MKNTIKTAILFLILITNSYGQDAEKIAKKITTKMCDCLRNVEKYENLNSKIDSCSLLERKKFAELYATGNELNFFSLNQNKIEYYIDLQIRSDCKTVKKIILKRVQENLINENSYPLNFTEDDLKKAKSNPKAYDRKIISLEGKIIEVKSVKLVKNKPYYKISLKVEMINGQSLWIASLVNAPFEKPGNSIRFLCYFIAGNNNNTNFNQMNFQVFSFGEIELKTKKLDFVMALVDKIIEWRKGKIPDIE